MAIFHVATNVPPKLDIIAKWIVDQPWGPGPGEALELVGSFHVEDPDGEVGMQVHLVQASGEIYQVPLTYRAVWSPQMEAAFMSTMEHSVLGTRFVYDGMGDERFVSVFAGVAACGYGQTLGFAQHNGRWEAWPETTTIQGHGRVAGRVLVDGFEPIASAGTDRVVLRNEQIELTVYRRLVARGTPSIGTTAILPGQPAPVALAEVVELVT